MKKPAILYLAFLLFSACASTDSSESKNVSQDEIWQSYWVDYNEAEEKLTGGATFRFGGSTGTTLQLTEPSKLTFEDTELDFTSGVLIKGVIGGTHYGYEGRGAYKGKYSFEYTDNTGKLYVNSISAKALEVDSVPEVLNAAGSNVISFKTAPLAAGEDLSISVSKQDGNTVTFEDVKVTGKSAFIEGQTLSELGNGNVTITLKKYKRIETLQQGGHLGGQISLTYSTKAYASKIANAKKPVAKQDSSVTTNN